MGQVHHIGSSEADLPLDPGLHSVENEAMLLSGLLNLNELFDDVAEIVRPDDFYEPVHRRIFEAMSAEIARGGVATAVSIAPALAHDASLKELGGNAYLAQLSGSSGVAALGTRGGAEIVAELAQLRRIYERLRESLVAIADGTTKKAAEAAALIEAIAFEESAHRDKAARNFTIAESVDRVLERIAQIRMTGQSIGAIAPDIPELSEIVGPLERKHFQVWAGRPGMGKSALMCGAARSIASAGYGVGLVSLEMSDIDLGTRFSADAAMSFGEPIRHDRIRDAKVSDSELKTLVAAANQIRDMPLILADLSGITMARLAMKARQMKREIEARGFTLDVLFVDYLQLVHSDRRYENKVAEVTDVSAGLKRLAKELDCAVVAASQLSRKVEERDDKHPHLADLRESGSIEQDADTVCFLYREEYYLRDREPNRNDKPSAWDAWDIAMRACQDELELIVPKRRSGKEGKTKCRYFRDYQAVRAKDFVVPQGFIR
jgi:replicative DNA helicase